MKNNSSSYLNDICKEILSKNRIDALLISSPQNISYLSHYYGFSDNERDAYILATQKNVYLLTNPLYENAIQSLSAFTPIISNSEHPFKKNLKDILTKEHIQTLGFEDSNLTVAEFQNMQFEKVSYYPVSLSHLRIKKTNVEIAAIQKACDLTDNAFIYIRSAPVSSDMTERELARKLELYIRKNGADLSFPTIVAFGKNAATPHHHTGDTKLGKHNLILIDFGVKLNNYCSDMTRTFFISPPTAEQQSAYDTVRTSQKKAIEFIEKQLAEKKEIRAKDVDRVAREYIVSQNYPSIPHSLGHGIGLEVHEAPSLSPLSKDTLTNGMVFSIEPGIYLPHKLGIRIEDLFTIKEDKLIRLTKSPS